LWVPLCSSFFALVISVTLMVEDSGFQVFAVVVWLLVFVWTVLSMHLLLRSNRYRVPMSKNHLMQFYDMLEAICVTPIVLVWFVLAPWIFGQAYVSMGLFINGQVDLVDSFVGAAVSYLFYVVGMWYGSNRASIDRRGFSPGNTERLDEPGP